MFDGCNVTANLVLAGLLTLSPYFFDNFDTDIGNIQQMYVQAQARADHIVQTGDMSDLASMNEAATQMALYQRNLNVIGPVIQQMQEKLAEKGIPLPLPTDDL